MKHLFVICIILAFVATTIPAQAASKRARRSDAVSTVTLQPVRKPAPSVVKLAPVIKGKKKQAPVEAPDNVRLRPEARPALPKEPEEIKLPEKIEEPVQTAKPEVASKADKQLADLIAGPATAATRDKLRAYVVNHSNPDQSVPALMRIGGISMELGDYADAANTFDNAVKLTPKPAEKAIAREGLFEALLHQNQTDKAEAAYNTLRSESPDHVMNPTTQIDAGMMLSMQGKPAEARAAWTQVERTLQTMTAPEADALKPRLALVRALADELEGKIDHARAGYEDLVSRQPKSQAAVLARARIADISRPLTSTATPASTAKP